MEYSERISIRDFVLDYLIEAGGVIEAEADSVQEELEFDPIAHCEYTCDLTLWHERLVKEAA